MNFRDASRNPRVTITGEKGLVVSPQSNPNGGLTPEQRAEIAELANSHSRSKRAFPMFLRVAEAWISAGEDSDSAGFVTRQNLIEELDDPFSEAALCKLLPRWASFGAVEVGAKGVRAGPKLREIIERKPGSSQPNQGASGVVDVSARNLPPRRASGPHNAALVSGMIDVFVEAVSVAKNVPRTEVLTSLFLWEGTSEELADCICGLIAGARNGIFPKDPVLALDEICRGVSNLKPVDTGTFALLSMKLTQAQNIENSERAHANQTFALNFEQNFHQVLDELLAKQSGEVSANEIESQPPLDECAQPKVTLKALASGAPEIPKDQPWGQPRPPGSSPAA
jgi:hypothetical protein